MPDETRAFRTAKEMAHRHTGVITWSRDANLLATGDFGPPVELFREGDVPDLD